MCDNELYASMFANGRCRAWLLILLGCVSPVSGNFQSRKTGTKPPCFFSPFRLYDSSYLFLSFGFSFHVSNRSFVCLRNITLIVLLLRFVIRIARVFWKTVTLMVERNYCDHNFSTSEIIVYEYGTSYL